MTRDQITLMKRNQFPSLNFTSLKALMDTTTQTNVLAKFIYDILM